VISAALLLAVVSVTTWLALRALSGTVTADIPACCRPRVRWWLDNATLLTAWCVAILVAAGALAIAACFR
jgi:hypothetical protein